MLSKPSKFGIMICTQNPSSKQMGRIRSAEDDHNTVRFLVDEPKDPIQKRPVYTLTAFFRTHHRGWEPMLDVPGCSTIHSIEQAEHNSAKIAQRAAKRLPNLTEFTDSFPNGFKALRLLVPLLIQTQDPQHGAMTTMPPLGMLSMREIARISPCGFERSWALWNRRSAAAPSNPASLVPAAKHVLPQEARNICLQQRLNKVLRPRLTEKTGWQHVCLQTAPQSQPGPVTQLGKKGGGGRNKQLQKWTYEKDNIMTMTGINSGIDSGIIMQQLGQYKMQAWSSFYATSLVSMFRSAHQDGVHVSLCMTKQ